MRARRVDENLSEIVAAARACGLLVWVRNDELGDLDCQYAGKHEVWEVKTAVGSLTRAQAALRGMGWRIRIVRSVPEALDAAKAMRASG